MRRIRCSTGLPVLLLALTTAFAPGLQAKQWQPAGIEQIRLWPDRLPIERPQTRGKERETIGPTKVAGQAWTQIENVSRPTMSIFPAKGANSGAAVVVFPGGGYRVLAIDLEGTEVCDWLTAKGVTCVLLKYRVPGSGPYWNDECNCRRIPQVPMALQDAQRAIGLLRQQAKGLGIDPHKIGVLGFSAGGHLVAAVSTEQARRYIPVDAADQNSSRPDFAVVLYPGHLWTGDGLGLAADIRVGNQTPPTFMLHAQNDPVDDVRHSLAYYMALRQTKVPVELHLFAEGGHAFGLRPTAFPITHWPTLVERWMRSIGILAKTPQPD
jgi:acetyl esterase/lipase